MSRHSKIPKLHIFSIFMGLALYHAVAWGQAADSSNADPNSEVRHSISAERATVKLDQEAVLATDQPGTLDEIKFQEGQRVKQEDVVAELKNEVAKAALAVAEKTAESDIDIRYAKTASAVADKELEKSVMANATKKNTIPELEIDRLRLSAERATLQIEKAKLEREVASLQRDEKAAELRRHTIRSPLDGIVTEVFKHAGEAVQQGDPILRIVNIDVVRVEGFVSVADAARIQPGDRVEVQIGLEGLPTALLDKTFEGEIIFVDPTVGSIRKDVRVWARVKNPNNLLKSGLPARMQITVANETVTENGLESGVTR